MKFSLLGSVSPVALAASLLIGGGGAAMAGTITGTYYINGADSYVTDLQETAAFIGTITIPKANLTANQHLTGVSVTEAIANKATGYLTNSGDSAQTFGTTYDSTFEFVTTGSTPSSLPLLDESITAKSGNFSLNGSATKDLDISKTFTTGPASIASNALSQYLGSGSFTVDVDANGVSGETGNSDETYHLSGSALADVSITYHFDTTTPPPPSVPEPGSLAILGAALTGIGVIRRRRKS